MVQLSVTDTIDGNEYTAKMPYPRNLWDDVDEHGREELRLIARHRFGNWAQKQTGLRLATEHLDALPVTVS